MPYDLFVSYSRRDNKRGQVTALKARVEASFSAFSGRDLQVFFDAHEIAGMDDWRQKIQGALPWIRAAAAKRFAGLEDDRLGLFRQSQELLYGLRLFQSAGVVDENKDPLVIRMHRLVQEIVRSRAHDEGESEQRALIPVVREDCEKLRALHAHPGDRWLIPVLEATADRWLTGAAGTEPQLANDAAFVATAVSMALITGGSWSRAEGLLLRALNLAQSVGLEADGIVPILNNLGEALQEMGRRTEAEPLFRQALTIRRNAPSLNNLARLLLAGDRLDEAETLCREALRIDEQQYGPDHPEVAPDINTLALVLKEKNKLSEAEQLFRRALAIQRKRVPPDLPILAGALNNLGDLLYAMGRTREAEPMFGEALTIDEMNSGPTGPMVALRLNNLAEILRTTNRLVEAEPLYRRAIAILEGHPDNLYAEHSQLASTLNNLGLLLQTTERPAEAEPLFRDAVSIWRKSLGDEHAQVAIGLGNLAELLRRGNRLAEAQPLARQAVVIIARFTATTRADHPLLHAILEDYCRLLIQCGRTETQSREEVIEAAAEGGLNIGSNSQSAPLQRKGTVSMPTSALYQRLVATYTNRELVDTFLRQIAERNKADRSLQNQPEAFCAVIEEHGSAKEIAQIANAARAFFDSADVKRFRELFDLDDIRPKEKKPWWRFW